MFDSDVGRGVLVPVLSGTFAVTPTLPPEVLDSVVFAVSSVDVCVRAT